ncbi:MAG: hypothetical protein J4F37_04495 [Acidobacteria bacterium]|nr:hypothetical protein [Acidobacteriota bacterium]
MKRFQFFLLAIVLSTVWACQSSTGPQGHRRPSGKEIVTVAGNGTAGYSGDGGPAAQAQLNQPFGVVRGPNGDLYICDTGNHVIRRVAADGTIATVAGNGKAGYSGDGGPALEARLNEPYEIRFDPQGNMLFVERVNHVVRRVDRQTGLISTLAGTGQEGFSGDGGPAVAARLSQPHSIQLGPSGDLFICDIGNHRVRRVGEDGRILTFAGTGGQGKTPDGATIEGTPLNGPRALDFDAEGNLWLALREGNAVYRIDMKARSIHHVAGTGESGFTGHGQPALQATLSGPKGLSVGPEGNIYLADTESHSIRMVDRGRGTLELVAGTGEPGDGPEGDPLNCRMGRPHGVFVDSDGAVFVGDTNAHRVRVIRSRKKREG